MSVYQYYNLDFCLLIRIFIMYSKRGTDVLFRAKPMQESVNQSVGRFQTLDTESGEIMAKYLYIEGNPKQYRFDAKEGVFSVHYDENNIEKVGSSLSFQPIAWRIFSDDILGLGLKTWAELFFIDETGCVSEVLFHGYSVANLERLIQPLYYNRVKLNEVVLTVNADKKENTKITPKGVYFIASFTYKLADKVQTEEFSDYVQTVLLYRRDTLTEKAQVRVIKNVFNPFIDVTGEHEQAACLQEPVEETVAA